MQYIFNFPETRFVPGAKDVSRRGQADQITQEAAEVFSAAESGDSLEYIGELMDCIHACETALREFSPQLLKKAMADCRAKNVNRGYYPDGALQAFYHERMTECTREFLTMTPVTIERIEESDSVKHPAHYTQGDIECIDAIKASMSHEEFCGYLRGNVQKYVWRFRNKNGVEDLRKAEWYLNRLIEENDYDMHGEEVIPDEKD